MSFALANFVPKNAILLRSGSQCRRMESLSAASTAAASGDLIEVGSGSYSVTANLAKNGVNWHFADGATVTYTPEDGSLWDDNGGMSFSIGGRAVFTRSGAGNGAGDNVFLFRSAASVINVRCKKVLYPQTTVTFPDNGEGSCIAHLFGTVKFECDEIDAVNLSAIWWESGNGHYKAHRINSGADGGGSVYSTPTASGGVHPLGGVYVSGHLWVQCQDMTSGNCAVQIAGSGGTAARVWVDVAGEISGSPIATYGTIYLAGDERAYITCQKVSSTTAQPTIEISSSGTGEAWLDAQKLTCGLMGVRSLASNTQKLWLNLGQIETSANTTHLTSLAGSPTIYLRGSDFGDARSGVSGFNIAGGELNLLSGKIRTHSAQSDLVQTGGTLNIGNNVDFDPTKTTGTLTHRGRLHGLTPADLSLLSQVFN